MQKTVDDWFEIEISPQSEYENITACRKEDGVNVRVNLSGKYFFSTH